jgi:hypothetical protein
MDVPLYHHCFPFEAVKFGKIKPAPKYTKLKHKGGDKIDAEICKYDLRANFWLKKKIGFYPLFFAVGTNNNDIRATGYADQWRRIISWSKNGNKYRGKGGFSNEVLFSFEQIENGVFLDFEYWFMVYNGEGTTSEYYSKIVLKESWTKNQWIKRSIQKPCSVMMVAPEMDLREAKRIWVRNKQTQRVLEKMGFSNVEVKRLKLEGDAS